MFGKKEWVVPKTPSESNKREKNQRYDGYPVDIAVFESERHLGDYRHLLFFVECKHPDISVGLQQLEIYLGLEPFIKLGIWANTPDPSAEALFVFKDSKGIQKPGKRTVKDLPSANQKIDPASVKFFFKDLVVPSNEVLRRLFSDLLDRVVARDSNVTRREDQLDQLCNLILLKLENDKKGRAAAKAELFFAPRASETLTAKEIRKKFATFTSIYPDIFINPTDKQLRFSDHTLHECVDELAKYNLIDVSADTVSMAFQVLRSAALKQEEGQYFTPRPVIEAAVRLMQIDWDDIILDPACGTGGFLIQCLLEMNHRHPARQSDISRWAQTHLFGIDKDAIGIKLTKAVMQILGDGSAHCVRGDSVLTHTWPTEYPHLMSNQFQNGRFTVILTNPPFGAPLKITHAQAKKAGLSIANQLEAGEDLELGLAVFNRCHDLLGVDGYLCIVLPETYFFSPSYAYVRTWCNQRFRPVGVVNVPMEAFQGFCRAKTNLYVFQKSGDND
ncbi:MAG: N-6 DNA methylase [Deltaproteobacteria bacterium]|nr:N-6 DNA methylase [Deltaproteobacteria bacterium]